MIQVIYKPTGKKHALTKEQVAQWEKAGFSFKVVEQIEKPKIIKEKQSETIQE